MKVLTLERELFDKIFFLIYYQMFKTFLFFINLNIYSKLFEVISLNYNLKMHGHQIFELLQTENNITRYFNLFALSQIKQI
mgnify:CR=1 FL=1